jgi:hypothetical protein
MAKYTMKWVSLAEYYDTKPCIVTFVQVTLLRTLLCRYHGAMHFPMVGPWSGIRPRPTQVPPNDVELGLSSTSVARRLVVSHFDFPLQLLKT